MKGYPNQVADLETLALAISCVGRLIEQGRNPRDDGELGEFLVRERVLSTDRKRLPIEDYIRAQRAIAKKSNQSLRTRARFLRELFRILGLIAIRGVDVSMTLEGRTAAAFAGIPLGEEQIFFWRRVIRNSTHYGGDVTESHPYQVLLRLVARCPGIDRAHCALALEARDDSQEELDRIAKLAMLDQREIRQKIGASKSNWDNAKKILPSFAEQLGDIVKTHEGYRLAEMLRVGPPRERDTPDIAAAQRQGRAPRRVTPETIGMAGIAERDELPPAIGVDPVAAAEATRTRHQRLRRHNILLRKLAMRLGNAGMSLDEGPFDMFAAIRRVGVLVEVKTVDGTSEDERERVRDALSQLLHYEAFALRLIPEGRVVYKVACFEAQISAEHQAWLNKFGIAVIWQDGDLFAGDALAAGVLGRYLEELG